MNNYITFYIFGKPFVSVQLGHNYTNYYNILFKQRFFSLKKKLFLVYVFICVLFQNFLLKFKLNFDNFLFKRELEWIKVNFKEVFVKSNALIIIHSLVEGRQRMYLFFYDEKYNNIYFSKFLSKTDDFDKIYNEKKNLDFLKKNKKILNQFDYPDLIGFKKNMNFCCLITSAIPDFYKLYHPSNNNFPFDKKRICIDLVKKSLSEIYNLEWFKDFQKNNSDFKYLSNFILNSNKNTNINLGFCHGDFGSENIFSLDNNFFIIDWETSFQLSPIYVDYVAFWLGKYHAEIKKNSKTIKNKFFTHFSNFDKLDIALSLIFLINNNFDLAKTIGKEFK